MGSDYAGCSAVFDDATVALLRGSDTAEPLCFWLSDTRVQAALNQHSSIQPGQLITVRPGAVHSAASSSCEGKCANGSLPLLLPLKPHTPTALISDAQSMLSVCDDLLLSGVDSTGGVKRTATYTPHAQPHA